jgi:predicted methyltransferase
MSFNKIIVVGKFVLVAAVGSSEVSVLDLNSGKSLNQIYLADGDFLISQPIVTENSTVFISLRGVSVFSGGGCAGFMTKNRSD